MSAIANEIDRILEANPAPADPAPLDRALLIASSAPGGFKVEADGTATPASIDLTAILLNLPGTVTWSAGVLLTINGNHASLAYAPAVGESAEIFARITVDGVLYERSIVVGTVRDGADSTPPDLSPAALKAALENQITESELYSTLRTRIGLIDADSNVVGSVAAQVKAETDSRVLALTQEAADRKTYVQDYTYSKGETNSALSVQASTIASDYRQYADAAKTAAITAASADVRSYGYSRSDSDGALSALSNTLTANYQAGDGATLTSAQSYVKDYAYSKSDTTSAIATSEATLRSEFASNNGASTSWVQDYAYSKAQTDSAIASSTQTLSTTVSGHTATLQTQGESINGLSLQYTVKFDNNGYASGFGLASTPVNGVPTSSFIVLSDNFAVAAPGVAPKTMFVVGNVNGHSTIGITGDVFIDGTMVLRSESGAPVVDANGLRSGFEAPGTLNSDLTPAINAASVKGAAINDDPAIENAGAWVIDSAVVISPGPSGVSGAVGRAYFSHEAPGAVDSSVHTLRRFPIDASRTYSLTANLYAATGNARNMYVFINFYGADGNPVTRGGAWDVWGGSMNGYAYGGLPPSGMWSRQGSNIGAGTSRAIPPAARTAEIGVWFQYSDGSGFVQQAAQDLRCEDVTAAVQAQAAAAADATAKADAAKQAAIAAAQAKADLAQTTANAYADGIVTDAEGRAIAAAQAKADAAQAAATSAAAADATAKANVAATTSDWGGVAGRPANVAALTGSEPILNSGISIGANGALNGAGGGQVTSLPVVDTRFENTPPSDYAVCHIKEFKAQTAVGIPGAAVGTYCVIETLKGWLDSSGGNAMQWAYIDSGAVWKRSAGASAGAWGQWVRDLDTSVYTGPMDPTKGAPSGTLVGGTDAGLVASRALNGDSAYNALSGINTAIADKLSKAGNQVLSGPITLSSSGAIVVGNTTTGVVTNTSGIVVREGGQTVVALTPGGVAVKADLSGSTGTFGTVKVGSTLSIGQTGYNTGTGAFLGFDGGVPKFSLGTPGVSGMRWDGIKLTIENPAVASGFSTSIANTLNQYYWTVGRNNTNGFAGTYTANSANGSGSYSYSWSVSTAGTIRVWISGSSTLQQASLSVAASGLTGEFDVYITCVTTDLGTNISRTATQLTVVSFT